MDEVRCPYCVDGNAFRTMVPDVHDGRLICLACGHEVRPDDSQFKCNCFKCHDNDRLCIQENKGSTEPVPGSLIRNVSLIEKRAAVKKLRSQISSESDYAQLKKLARALEAIIGEME